MVHAVSAIFLAAQNVPHSPHVIIVYWYVFLLALKTVILVTVFAPMMTTNGIQIFRSAKNLEQLVISPNCKVESV